MIASYSNNFIFIKTRKTAGTSAEILLSTWCSGKDICTTITGNDEITRMKFGGRAINFCSPENVARFNAIAETGNAEAIQKFRKEISPAFYNHMPASKVRELLPDLWENAYKFTVDRHPYEKVVSLAWWRFKTGGRGLAKKVIGKTWNRVLGHRSKNLNYSIDEIIDKKKFLNCHLYSETESLIVDEVIPYESMWERIGEIGSDWDMNIQKIPRAKSRSRLDRRPASEILSSTQKRKIADIAAFEFEILGYPE